jgi:uroporphyrinogen III methyltransferase / synthase
MERIVITASAGSFPGLAEALRAPGRTVAEQPLIQFSAPPNWTPLDHALDRLQKYEALAVTSPRAATVLVTRLTHLGIRWPLVKAPAVWAAGAASAAALGANLGSVRTPDDREVGSSGAAAALAQLMLDERVGGPVLFPCGSTRRELLPSRLRAGGVSVDEVVCYQSILVEESMANAVAAGATLLIVASPSVAHLLIDACPPGSRPDLIAVGPTTAAAARDGGWEPAAVASYPAPDAVVAAASEVLARRSVS